MSDLKIKPAAPEPPKLSGSGAVGGGGKAETPDFTDSVKTARKNLVDGDLRSLLDKARGLGETFFRSPDEKKLDTYKQSIKDYLNRASKELFSLRQELGNSHKGQQKVYQLVDTVNAEIDTLTRETLQKDKALQLLGSLDDIRGLILDLFG